jgi:hypothetical protein
MIKFCIFGGLALLLISAVMLICQFKVPAAFNSIYEDIMSCIGLAGTMLFSWGVLCVIG